MDKENLQFKPIPENTEENQESPNKSIEHKPIHHRHSHTFIKVLSPMHNIQTPSQQSPRRASTSGIQDQRLKNGPTYLNHDELPVLRISPRSSKTKYSPPSRSPQRIGSALSTRRSLSSSIDEELCRICHESGSIEKLFSPCYCTGSIGLLHISCLQRWLGSSNKTCCELCRFQFKLERSPKPFRKFLTNPGTRSDKRHLVCDIVSFALLTPTTLAIISLSIAGGMMYNVRSVEAIMLYCLTMVLIFLYSAWMVMCIRQNYGLWKEWKMFNQNVRILCEPSDDELVTTINSPNSKTKLQRIKLSSILIKLSTDTSQNKQKHSPKLKQDHLRLSESNIAPSVAGSGACSERSAMMIPDNMYQNRSLHTSISDIRDREHSQCGPSRNKKVLSPNKLHRSFSDVAGQQRTNITTPNYNGEEAIRAGSTETYI